MDRRTVIGTLAGGLLAAPLAALAAQPAKTWRIGLLIPGALPDCGSPAPSPASEALREGLRMHGLMEVKRTLWSSAA